MPPSWMSRSSDPTCIASQDIERSNPKKANYMERWTKNEDSLALERGRRSNEVRGIVERKDDILAKREVLGSK